MKILFDSNDYENEMDVDIIIDELGHILRNRTRKLRGEIVGFVFKSTRQSRYGAICNNGQIGFSRKMIPNLTKAVLSIESDSIVIWDNEGELLVSYYDHDGSHNCTIHPITKSKLQTIQIKENNFDKMIAYVETMTTVKIKK